MPHASLRDSLPGVTPLGPFGACLQAPPGGVGLAALSVPALRELVREHHLLLLRDFTSPEDAPELADWCRGWGEVMRWPFGDVLELREADTPTDHIFDSSCVPFHWDGMYKPFIPEFQVFHCVRAPGDDGGRTTFCDTVQLLADAHPAVLSLWHEVTVTYRIRNVVHYGGQAVSPLIVPHPGTGVPTLRFNEPPPQDDSDFLNRPEHHFDGIAAERVPELLAGLHDALHDPRHFYGHSWQQGDIVVADNYALLHGRESFTSRAPRHLRRVHVLGSPPFANPAVRRDGDGSGA
ncbi:TauD/TfdA dioxygenase family protein [Streptomyces sp. KR80]|uniref:TauD/TfdA dioxygenase family protein n=1 Tax=Streptomyces sp. KR80 TaxID=3457426 RepID=UPI003FD43242